MRWSVLALVLFLMGCAGPLGPSSDTTLLSLKPGKSKKPPTPPAPTTGAISLNAGSWETLSVPSRFTLANSAGALTFAFPSAPNSINYLYAEGRRSLAGSLSVAFTITGTAPVFNAAPWDTCPGPPKLMLYFQANNDWSSDNGRWWFQSPVQLAIGSFSLTAALDPALWTNVSGQHNAAAFADAARNVTGLGITFGGGCFAGHGVNLLSGSAIFALTEYRVQ